MDEMHVKEGLVFDKHSGELIGFTDLGDINNHIAKLERTAATSQKIEPLANSLLVLMIRGLLSGFQFPYAQFSCSSLTGDQLYNIFWDCVERLERYFKITTTSFILIVAHCRMDIKVLCVTCDGYSVNRRFLKLHNCEGVGTSISHKLLNPYSPEPGRKYIYFVSDPPHLIKTVRNSWASKKRDLWVWHLA